MKNRRLALAVIIVFVTLMSGLRRLAPLSFAAVDCGLKDGSQSGKPPSAFRESAANDPHYAFRESVNRNPHSAIKHWAFIAPARPALPEVKNGSRVKAPIDRFILARLENEGLTPSPEADRVTLLRRLSLDLIGLPPTVAAVGAFLNDGSPDACEDTVQAMMSLPH